MQEKMKIEDAFKKLYKGRGVSSRELMQTFLKEVTDTHPYEEMLDKEYIFPRGIDFLQQVVCETYWLRKKNDLKDLELRNQLLNTKNFEWTKKWIREIEHMESVKFDYKREAKIKIDDLAKRYLLDTNYTVLKLTRNSISKAYCLKVDNTWFLLQEGYKKLIKESKEWYLMEMQYRSLWINENLIDEKGRSILKRSFTQIEDMESYRKKFLKKKKKNIKKAEVKNEITKPLYDLNQYFEKTNRLRNRFLDLIKKYHPYETMLVSKRVDGKAQLFLTLKGVAYLNQIILSPIESESNRIQKDLKWSENWMKQNNIPFPEINEISVFEYRQICNLEFEEFQSMLFLTRTTPINGFLNSKQIEDLEFIYPNLKLRRYSKQMALFEKVEIAPSETTKIQKQETRSKFKIEVHDLQPMKWYEGYINKQYSINHFHSCSFGTFDVLLDKYLTVKIRIPWEIMKQNAKHAFFLPGMRVRFQVSLSPVSKKYRVEHLIIAEKIKIDYDWNQSIFLYAPYPRVKDDQFQKEVDRS